MPFQVDTTDRLDIVDITGEVEDRVPADVVQGVCTVFVQHTTAGVVVNEAEQRLLGDIESYLRELVSEDDGYAHDALDGNADSHLRALLLDESVSVPVRDGSLALGTWQSILLVDCDGPRTRSVTVTFTS
ncbi:secondary thiamine-phosphate synthase enzyme YjbQ [Haloarcula salinisoli]|uniref:Secondary thiamine-phosphate synthase enzyme YjbQ n=1 Tax=Haloarcula salinisoli TaxID=2487746 RepID=A0A8J7YGD6_9EURY|nr:secondary thiamine-phosphate synthase enzyme YjbQ [Halomicroarcula salinisoli]MBX0286288.1 secondary thiamine-phosphate synthase enzyme YjbQ [Halomicroarcula salinisoli]MBX0302224.1 secondary thiamine-phosphate synthase enzyme YjbQ [Halomicroarcula salinisoli]